MEIIFFTANLSIVLFFYFLYSLFSTKTVSAILSLFLEMNSYHFFIFCMDFNFMERLSIIINLMKILNFTVYITELQYFDRVIFSIDIYIDKDSQYAMLKIAYPNCHQRHRILRILRGMFYLFIK